MNNGIVEQLWERREEALKSISEQYGGLLNSLARRILTSEEDAEECVNDVLLEIWNTIPPARPDSVSSYACMLTRRTAIDRLRRNNAVKRRGNEYATALDELDEVLGGEADPELTQGELTEALNSFLSHLGADERGIFMSRYFGFEAPAVIAQRYSLTTNALNVRLSRIRSRLKAYLNERGIFI